MGKSSKLSLPPGPKGKAIVGNFNDFKSAGFYKYYMEAWQKFGDICRLTVGPFNIIQFVHPEHIHQILGRNRANYPKLQSHEIIRKYLGNSIFTNTGKVWENQRKLLSPGYRPKSIEPYHYMMTDSVQGMLVRWDRDFGDGNQFNLNEEMHRVTMTVISRTAFNLDIYESNNLDVATSINFMMTLLTHRAHLTIRPPLFLPNKNNRKYKKAVGVVDTFFYGMIKKHKENPGDHDMLDLMLAAEDEETGKHLSDQSLRDELLMMFYAGHDTTASLMKWAFFWLSQYPEVQEKIRAEVDRVFGDKIPSLEQIKELKYTKMVIEEVLRVQSPVAFFARDAMDDDEVGGYLIPKGSIILISSIINQKLFHRIHSNAST